MRVIFAAILVVFTITTTVTAQSFQVRPLLVEGDVNPGTTVEIPILVAPTTLLEEQTIDVRVVQLAQTSSGAFLAIEEPDSAENPRSSVSWINAPESIVLDPPDVTTLTVTMDVPIDARGSYAAGLLLSLDPPEDAVGLRVTVRLLVPIIVGTSGRIAQRDVRMADANLRYEFPEPENPAQETLDLDVAPETTLVDAIIENNGGTFSRFRGNLWVDVASDGGDWRQVRRVEIGETRLLPETAIALPVNLGRLLPEGDYRIRGELYVDGRRTAPLTREIFFAGHPAVDDLVTDIDLPIEPHVFEYSYAPGATRSGVITIGNPAISPIDVDLSVDLPSGMQGRASATMRDVDISAVDWITVAPPTIRLRPGETRNVRILARFPDTEADRENYYAEIRAEARYIDGQRAGTASGLVEVSRMEGEPTPALELTALQITATDSAETYGLSLRAVNTGDMRLNPEVSFVLVDTGGNPVASGAFDQDVDAPLLPLEERAYGGTLDVQGLPPAEYVLLVTGSHEEAGLAEKRVSVVVDDDGTMAVSTSR